MKPRKIFFFVSFLAFFSTALLLGYFYFSSAKETALHKDHEKAEAYLRNTKLHISSQIDALGKETNLLADNETVKKILADSGSVPLSAANQVLDYFLKDLGVSVCYLMDAQGLTIASSNRNDEKSFVGNNYGFRPYFIQAIQGQPAMYMALGVTSNERGIYYSYPVFADNGDKPVGVAVIKSSIQHLHINEVNNVKDGVVLLSDPNGVIFVSGRDDWLFKLLRQSSPETIANIEKSRQFGTGPWPWVGLTQDENGHATDAEGKKYVVYHETIKELPGWELSYFHDLNYISSEVYNLLLKSVGTTALIFTLVMGSIIMYLYRGALNELRRRKAAEEANEKLIKELRDALAEIKTLRGIIPICCICKKIRDDQGFWNLVESYVQEHTEAKFSHGLCPDCSKNYYPQIFDKSGKIRED